MKTFSIENKQKGSALLISLGSREATENKIYFRCEGEQCQIFMARCP